MRPRPKQYRPKRYPKANLPDPYDKRSPDYAERNRVTTRTIEGRKVITIGGPTAS